MKLTGQALYDEIVRHFVKKFGGCFVIVGTDAIFAKLFNDTLKYLGLAKSSLHKSGEIGQAFKLLSDLCASYKHVLIFFDVNLNGRSTVGYFRQLKEIFGDKCSVICTSSESGRERQIYLKEMGADNIIVKPVTMPSLIQKTALTIRPNNRFSRMVDSASKLIAANKYFEASGTVENLLKEKPDSAVAFMLKGDIHRKKKEYAEAESAYKMAVHNSELFIEPLKRLAELYAETEQNENRLRQLKHLDKISPLNHERKVEIGNTYLDMNQSVEARDYFDEAISLVKRQNDELMAGTLMNIGRQMFDKDPEGALEYMRQAIDLKEEFLSKDDIWMFNEIGLGLRKNGQTSQAVEYYRRAKSLAASDGAIDYNIGLAEAERGNTQEAIAHIERAIEKSPEIMNHSPLVPYNLATLYRQNDQLREAAQYYKICLVLDPAYKDASSRLAELQGKL